MIQLDFIALIAHSILDPDSRIILQLSSPIKYNRVLIASIKDNQMSN